MRDLRQLVQVDAQVVGTGTRLAARVLDHLDVVDAGDVPGASDLVTGKREHRDDGGPLRRVEPLMVALGGGDGGPAPHIPQQAEPRLPGSRSSRPDASCSRWLPATVNACWRRTRSQTPSSGALSQFWHGAPSGCTDTARCANRDRSYSRSTTVATHHPVMSSRRSSNRPPAIRRSGGGASGARLGRGDDGLVQPQCERGREALRGGRDAGGRRACCHPRPAELPTDRGDRDVGEPARVDELEVGEARGHVEGDAVIRDAVLHAQPQGAQLAGKPLGAPGVHPAAGIPVATLGRDPVAAGRVRHGELEGAHERSQQHPLVSELDDGVRDQLPRTVVGDLATSLDPDGLDASNGELVAARQHPGGVGMTPQREHGIVFQEEQRVRRFAGRARLDQLVLQLPRRAVVHPAQPSGVQLHAPHDSSAMGAPSPGTIRACASTRSPSTGTRASAWTRVARVSPSPRMSGRGCCRSPWPMAPVRVSSRRFPSSPSRLPGSRHSGWSGAIGCGPPRRSPRAPTSPTMTHRTCLARPTRSPSPTCSPRASARPSASNRARTRSSSTTSSSTRAASRRVSHPGPSRCSRRAARRGCLASWAAPTRAVTRPTDRSSCGHTPVSAMRGWCRATRSPGCSPSLAPRGGSRSASRAGQAGRPIDAPTRCWSSGSTGSRGRPIPTWTPRCSATAAATSSRSRRSGRS